MPLLIDLLNEIEDTSTPQYTIYCDMDGVLTDFDGRFKQFSKGTSPQDYEARFGTEKFWDFIDNQIGTKFWSDMPWMSDGKALWDHISQFNPILLSAPSRNNESRLGKRNWVEKNLPGVKLILSAADKKQNYADGNNILIDDKESNIDQWIAKGGIGILHKNTADTLEKLSKYGI